MSLRSSSSQKRRRSLPLTSALPTDTNVETPRPRRSASSRMAMPRAPDCDENATRPRVGANGANVAFMQIAGSVFTTPMQFGPTMRIPWR
jgi:hypothetical protein